MGLVTKKPKANPQDAQFAHLIGLAVKECRRPHPKGRAGKSQIQY
jgi:hypothetical protein